MVLTFRHPGLQRQIAKAIDGFNPGLCCLTPLAYWMKTRASKTRGNPRNFAVHS